MTDEPTDRALCESIELQVKLLATAYEGDDPKAIDNALIRVSEARRMVANGMYDLIYADDPRYPDDGSLPSDPQRLRTATRLVLQATNNRHAI